VIERNAKPDDPGFNFDRTRLTEQVLAPVRDFPVGHRD